MSYNIKFNKAVSVIDFKKVRNTANFIIYNDEDTKKGLDNSLFVLCIYDGQTPIAIGRVVGDGVTAFFIKDVIVIPEYQRKGIGNIIMEELFKYIDSAAVDQAYVGLMSTKGKESFYEKFGFIRRPNNNFGSGMILYYDKK